VALIAVMLVASAGFAAEKENGKSSGGPFYLFKDGKATATIEVAKVPPEDACDLARAIDVFREDVARFGIPLGDRIDMTLRSRRGGGVDNRIQLVVEDRDPMTEDETVIDFPEEHVMRITGGKSGVVRALFRLLEEFGGVRYLYQSSGENRSHIPPRKELGIPRKTIKWDSAYKLGRLTGTTNSYIGPLPRLRRYFWKWDVKIGAKKCLYFNHAVSRNSLPVDDYREREVKPPDEFFPILNGKRFLPYKLEGHQSHAYWQPCYANPAVADEAVKNILAYLKKSPDTESMSLTVNDSGGHCQCERCLEMDGDGINVMRLSNRSESYYRWVNDVVGRVAKKYPTVKFGVLAYREVIDPPPFKLHPNVVPILCLNFHAAMDPEIMKARKKLIREWGEKAENIGFWGYDCGSWRYVIPRIYFDQQKEMVKYIHENGGQLGFSSLSAYFTVVEGPKVYLHFKLLENPDADVEEILTDWCEACVGEKAAPHLREYYKFWEDYWRDKATKTPWWDQRRGVLFNGQLFGTYMYGLELGDMARCRKIMEAVVDLAEKHGMEDQKQRAKLLILCFEWSETAAKAMGAEIFSPDGKLPDAEAAVNLLRAVPEAVRSFERWKAIPDETKQWPGCQGFVRKATDNVVSYSITAVTPFLDDSAVATALKKLSKKNNLPANVRAVAAGMLAGHARKPSENILKNGSFETEGDLGWTARTANLVVTRTNAAAIDGSHSLECDIQHGGYRATLNVGDLPSKSAYFVTAWVMVPEGTDVSKGRLEFYANSKPLWNRPKWRLEPGKWRYVCAFVPQKINKVTVTAKFGRFKKGTKAYIDDVRLFEIPSRP